MSKTRIVASVKLVWTAAICDPSGDHVGKPKVPASPLASIVGRPPASVSQSDPSLRTTAI